MRRIQRGDVIALAVAGLKLPPVGRVHDLDDDGIELRLFSWLTQYFTAGSMLIKRRDIRAVLWAGVESRPDEDDPDGETVYAMEPLGDFQKEWMVS